MKIDRNPLFLFILILFAARLNAQTTKVVTGRNVNLDSLQQKVEAEKDPKKKEQMTAGLIRLLPAENTTNKGTIDHLNLQVAMAYAYAKEVGKASAYANKLVNPGMVGEGRSRVALVLLKNGFVKEAGLLLKKAVEVTQPFLTAAAKTNYSQFAAASGYKYYCTDYAGVLYRQEKYEEALKYIQIAHWNFTPVRGTVNSIYAQVLVKLKKYDEAFVIIDEAVKNGQSTPAIKELIREVYVQSKGSDAGFDDYNAGIKAAFAAQTKATLAKEMVQEKAPEFSLKDLDGNTVSLAGLKGKTVVLDFWATWCGPCKASFPAMQMAVNKYKNDSTVKFLFIHTMEYSANATEEARKYLLDTKYPFQVLMDLKEKGVKGNKVVDSFNTSMIPAKFVIDKNGDLRFKMIGYHEGDEATLEQIVAMVELVR